MLMTLAYLGSRLNGSDVCTNCEKLNPQVSETVISDIGSWFAGMGLAKKGKIEDGGLLRRSCTIANHAHGKAFELVGTAMYHALFEFGPSIGVSDADKYEILFADPRKGQNIIKVGLMAKYNGELKRYTGSPYQRKPDLVLKGEGSGKRQWVELKSWRYNKKYLNKNGTGLNQSDFPLWDGFSKSLEDEDGGKVALKYTTNAHRQHFLDFVAARDELTDDYWLKEKNGAYFQNKPSSYRTWLQIWKPGKREWRELIKDTNGKYKLEKAVTTINVATPWIGKDKLVTTTSKEFRALQKFLTAAPKGMNINAFKNSVGYPLKEHESKYTNKQVASDLAGLSGSTVVPFNVPTFLALEVGNSTGKELMKKLFEEFGNDDFSELQKAIADGNFTEEQIDELRENLTNKMIELLGPWKYLAVDIPLLSDLENAVFDAFTGEEVEELRQMAANIELPEDYFENACEAP